MRLEIRVPRDDCQGAGHRPVFRARLLLLRARGEREPERPDSPVRAEGKVLQGHHGAGRPQNPEETEQQAEEKA